MLSVNLLRNLNLAVYHASGLLSGELLAPFAEQLGGVCTLRSAVALMYKSVSGGR